MINIMGQFFWVFLVAAGLLFVTGVYCLLASRNLIRLLIGLELLTKAVTLLIILAGYVTGRPETAQTLAITLIVIEVMVIAVAAGIVLNVYRQTQSLNANNLKQLKG